MKIFRDIYLIFWRDIKKFWAHKIRIYMSIVQPIIWFILMGSAMDNLTSKMSLLAASGVTLSKSMSLELVRKLFDGAPSYTSYVTGGMIAMTALFAGFFGGTTVLMDRRDGYLNKLLAAPISRASIPIGKMLAVAAQVILQVVIIIILAYVLDVDFSTGIAGIILIILIASVFGMGLSAISLALGARINSMMSLIAVTVAMTMPLMFSSPAMFPATAMPGWLKIISDWNPVTYVVLPIRALVYKGWVWQDLLFGIGITFAFTLISGYVAVYQYRGNSR